MHFRVESAEYNVLFQIDTPRVITDMTTFDADHARTQVHPIYVLLMNPAGVLTKKLIGSSKRAAILMNSFLGASGVVLGFIFFRLYTKTLIDALLLVFLFGLSASQLMLSIIPDTASLAICSLIATYTLFIFSIRKKRMNYPLWVLCGVFSLGVTTTNFMQTLICFGFSILITSRLELRKWAVRILSYISGVSLVVALLALVQKALYPSSVLFFLPEAYANEGRFGSFYVFQSPLVVLVQLFKHFGIINFIVPHPSVFTMADYQLPAITFSTSSEFGLFGIFGLVLWTGLWISFAFHCKKEIIVKPSAFLCSAVFCFWLCLFFNLVFHSFYGVAGEGKIEYFLYTGNFTFLVLSILAIPSMVVKRKVRILLVALIACVGINNLLVIREIIGVYAGSKI